MWARTYGWCFWEWVGAQLSAQMFPLIYMFYHCLLRTFNPADYAEPAQTEESYGGGSTWNNTGSMELEEGASKLI